MFVLLLAGGTALARHLRGPDESDASLALIDKLTGDAADGTILVIGDSTGNEPGEWPDRLGRLLAARYPAFTISYRQFNLSGFQEVWKHKGTGDHTLTIDNASWGGRSTRWHLAPHLAALVAVHPDLIYVNHGHNDGYTVPAEPYWRDDLLALTESLNLASPKSEIVLIAQNPRTADPSMDARRPVTQDVAQERGYGFVNVWQAFHDAAPDGVGSLLISDGIHPNPAGSAVWADAVLRDLVAGPTGVQKPSSLSMPVTSLVPGDFSSGYRLRVEGGRCGGRQRAPRRRRRRVARAREHRARSPEGPCGLDHRRGARARARRCARGRGDDLDHRGRRLASGAHHVQPARRRA